MTDLETFQQFFDRFNIPAQIEHQHGPQHLVKGTAVVLEVGVSFEFCFDAEGRYLATIEYAGELDSGTSVTLRDGTMEEFR